MKGVDTKELIFSPSPIGQTTFGAYVPIVAGSSPKTNIRILYDGGMKSCSQYTIIDSGSTGMYGILEYPLFHHYDDALNPTLDINFALCDFMFYDFYTPTDNNLYNSYWRRTINQINTGKMLIAYFNLKEDDIQSLKLNDKIRIDNSWWSINKVIDYDANKKQLTTVELLSTDSEIDFAPFKTKKPKQPKGAFAAVYTEVNQTITDNTNAVGIGADVIIKGRNNIVMPGIKGIIEGDGFVVGENGIYKGIDGVNVNGENFANADLIFTESHNHNLNGNYVNIFHLNQESLFVGAGQATIGYDTDFIQTDVTGLGFYIGGLKKMTISSANNIQINDKITFKDGITLPFKDVSATYTIFTADKVINCTANTFTVTLPSSVGLKGQQFTIKNSGAGVITLDGNGTQTIDGALTLVLATSVCYTVASDDSNWIILSSF